MHLSKAIYTLVGLFVAAGFVALFFLAMEVSNFSKFQGASGYTIKGRFENIGSLRVRSPVSVSGVRIGRVSAIKYDQERYEAVVHMLIDSQFATLPTDTNASIYTAGLLGEQYISLDPGGEEEYLKDGDDLQLTQSAFVLEEMLGKLLINKTQEDPKTDLTEKDL